MKKLSILLILITLSFSGILQVIPKVNFEPLKGFIPVEVYPEFSKESFLSLTFQDQAEKYVKQNIKWNPAAVRFNNQFKYDVYRELKSGIIEGKDGYLFESGYIDSYLGSDFIGRDSIWRQAEKLKDKIKALEESSGTKILVALAINKAIIHKDKLPTYIQAKVPDTTNYETYLEAFQHYEIPYIDLHEYIKNLAPKTEHPLTNKNGIHWTKYGGLVAADSLNQTIGNLIGKEVNRVFFDSITITDIPAKEDIDIAESLNLRQPIAKEIYHYPEFYLRPDSTFYKPKVLLIGDSFCWTVWNQYIPHEYWDKSSTFLYYNKQIWELTPTEEQGAWTKKEKRKSLVESAEVVVLLYSTFNLNNLGTGFLDE